MKEKCFFIFLLFSFLSCKNENSNPKIEKSIPCEEKFDRNLVFQKLNYYTKVNTVCNDEGTERFKEKRKKKVYIYFSDINFDFYVYDDNTRLIFDKKLEIWMAINSNGYIGYDFENGKNRFVGFYFLDKNLLPICLINQKFDVSIFTDDVKNKKLREFVVNLKNIEKTKLESLTYEQIVKIHSEIMKKNYSIIKEKKNYYLEDFYKNQPLWTIFYH